MVGRRTPGGEVLEQHQASSRPVTAQPDHPKQRHHDAPLSPPPAACPPRAASVVPAARARRYRCRPRGVRENLRAGGAPGRSGGQQGEVHTRPLPPSIHTADHHFQTVPSFQLLTHPPTHPPGIVVAQHHRLWVRQRRDRPDERHILLPKVSDEDRHVSAQELQRRGAAHVGSEREDQGRGG